MLLRRNFNKNLILKNESSNEATTIWNATQLRRPSLQRHDLYTLQTREVGDIIRDEKSGFTLEIIEENFPLRGNGKGKGKGLKILDHVKRNQVFCWSEEPLIEMVSLSSHKSIVITFFFGILKTCFKICFSSLSRFLIFSLFLTASKT